jgi:uncharacterized RDD family membrane protein YckC
VTSHRSYAGLVSRLSGLCVDILLVAVTIAIVGRGMPAAWKLVAVLPDWIDLVFRVAADLVPIVYFAACWRFTGETLGAWIFGTKVTLADGRPIGVVRAVARSLFGVGLAPLWFVGMLAVLFDGRRRSLLDMAFGTVVRYIPRTPPFSR